MALKRHKWFHSLLFRSSVSAGALCFGPETCGVSKKSARLVFPSQICPFSTTTLPKQKNWEFWHVLHTSVVEVNVLRTCRSLTASFFKNLIWPVPKFHCNYWVGKNLNCTRSKRTDMEGKNGDSCKKRWHELGKHHFLRPMLFTFCSVDLYLNYILHHGSKLKPQLVSLQNMQFLMSCKEDFNNQRPMFMAFLAGLHGCSTSKNPAIQRHVHDVFMHIPDFFARTWQWENPVTRHGSDALVGHTAVHPSCRQVNNRASWGRDAS